MTSATQLARGRPTEAPDDDALVARARGGDDDAFEGIMRRYNERLYRTARGITGDDAEAEDAVQEAYVQAWRHLDQYRGDGRLAGWLARIVVREALARGRRRRPAPSGDLADLDGPAAARGEAVGPADAAARRDLVRLLEEAIDGLPDAYRAVVVLRDVQGLGVSEAADALGLTRTNLKVRHHRARARLRRDLEARLGDAVAQPFAFRGRRCDRIVARVRRRLQEVPPASADGPDPGRRPPQPLL